MIDLKLRHYSDAPIGPILSVGQHNVTNLMFPYAKPRGLWFSVEGEDDWKSWCLSEGFCLDRLTHVHEVVLDQSANILRLMSPDDIDWFGRRYGAPGRRGYEHGIDWGRVADAWQGIIIAPYVWERRLARNASWYYGWDCASGCVWDATAVTSVTLLEITQVPVADGEDKEEDAA